MSFAMFRIEHAKAREIAQSTIRKYYKKTKIILWIEWFNFKLEKDLQKAKVDSYGKQ